ncbi:hypothetical protein MUP79_03610, partial [Candidatus Bathyarchaeota archaeon]|nr:hypothetical protein [Candidatus Bathyarchaeota archaeon]
MRTLAAVVLAIAVGSTAAVSAARFISSEGSWSGTVYIRLDGSIDPSDAPIQKQADTYILAGNIIGGAAGGIALERNSTIIDGAGYTLQGSNYDGVG